MCVSTSLSMKCWDGSSSERDAEDLSGRTKGHDNSLPTGPEGCEDLAVKLSTARKGPNEA